MKRFLTHPISLAVVVFIISMIGLKALLGPNTCRSGWQSPSIGRSGACSHHGGVDRSRSQLAFFGSLAAGGAAWFFFQRRRERQLPPRRQHISPIGPVEPTSRLAPLPDRDEMEVKPIVENPCPSCGSRMVRRLAKRGRNSGRYFWGCSKYPACHGTKPISE